LFALCKPDLKLVFSQISSWCLEEQIVKSVLECVMHEEMRTSSSTHQRVHCNGVEIFLWPARIVS